MSLDGLTLKRLRQESSGFATKNHRSYLAEAIACIRDTGDPVAAVRLLRAMWGSYASRDDQQVALNDIGKWLEDRLRRPQADTERVALELGWLRRFAQLAEATRDQRGNQEGLARNARRPSLAFGSHIESLVALRAQRPAAPRRPVAPPAPPPPPPPTELPRVFQAEFVRFDDARDARRTARKRQQLGKVARERLLDIRPNDPRFVALAAGLVCSVLETEGFDAPFEAAERDHGAPPVFYVTAIEERAGKRLARTISMTPPSRQEGSGG